MLSGARTRPEHTRPPSERDDGSGALHPDETEAYRTGVRNAQVSDKRDEAAVALAGARRANRGSRRIQRRDAQRTAGIGARNRDRPGWPPRDARPAVSAGVPAEEPVVQIETTVGAVFSAGFRHFGGGWSHRGGAARVLVLAG